MTLPTGMGGDNRLHGEIGVMCRWRSILGAGGLLLLLGVVAVADEQPARIQPDEQKVWSCEFPANVTAIVSSTATHLRGSPTPNATCTGLLSSVQIDGTNARLVKWLFTPASLDAAREHWCWVHVLVDDADGNRLACDGTVIVRVQRPPS